MKYNYTKRVSNKKYNDTTIKLNHLRAFRVKYSDYNLNKTISACIVAQKQTSQSFNKEQARKFCKEEIKKSIKGAE